MEKGQFQGQTMKNMNREEYLIKILGIAEGIKNDTLNTT